MTVVEFVCHGFKVHGVRNLLEMYNEAQAVLGIVWAEKARSNLMAAPLEESDQ